MRKKTYLLWKRILKRLGITALLVIIFYTYFYSGFFTLHTYKIIGAPEGYESELTQHIQEISNQKIYKILPGNRSISYHDSAIRELIMDTLPNTKDISIRSTGLHTLSIKLQSYTPVFSVGDGYAISEDATIYKEISPLADYSKLQIASTTQVQPATLKAVSLLSQKIGDVLFKVGFVSIDEYGDIRFYNKNKQSYVIIASDSDEGRVWSNILSAIDTNPLKKSLASNPTTLEYIDARFGNKVFYKFTNGAKPVIIPDTNDSTSTPPKAIQ